MIRSTLGFVYTADLSQVLLITKQKPIFHQGKLNGLGGKTEVGESSKHCIAREVEEEAGLNINPKNWIKVGNLDWTEWKVDIFVTKYDGSVEDLNPSEKHQVQWYSVKNLPSHCITNLFWLIPLGVDILTQPKPPKLTIKYPV